MEPATRFELRIDGELSMEIRVHPEAAPDAVIDMLSDAAATIREGIETMMVRGDALDKDGTTPTGAEPDKEPPPVEWRYFNYAPAKATGTQTRNIFASPRARRMIEHAFPDREVTEDTEGYTVDLGGGARVTFTRSGEVLSFDETGARFCAHDCSCNQGAPAAYESPAGTPPAAYLGRSLRDNYNAAIEKATIAATIDDPELCDRHWDRATAIRDSIVSNYTPEAINNGVAPESHNPR